jgi:hypothetical protein
VLDIWEYCDKLRSKNCEKTIFNPLTFREKFIFALLVSGKLNPSPPPTFPGKFVFGPGDI